MTGTKLVAPEPTVAKTWNLDPAHSGVSFAVKHLMIATVRGRMAVKQGVLHLDQQAPERSTVEAEVDAASIDTGVQQRDDHLRSADFLDAANHPVLRFRSTRVAPRGADAADVTGDLTIRGVTRPATFLVRLEGHARDPWGNARAAFSAETTIDRRDWGLTWNQLLETGGVVVGEKVKIALDLEATLAKEP